MRLEPIPRPSSFLGRVMSLGMRRVLGQAITPAQVLYNRVPRMWNVAWANLRLTNSLAMSRELALLLQTQIALRNGCEFCADIARAFAIRQAMGIERFDALACWQESEVFDDAERAALAYAEAMSDRCVDDAVFEQLRKHWSEREIAEITAVCALENYYNLINLALEIPSDGLERLALAG
ncbi:MAG: carboxymuconolactone decarboxylase family protein [Deltaproteobacteria bacterium]|nr:carboxymuconolactone decarboxylase family protein [Deltaproteobacteria bacterium]MBW2393333.1 carboxymuconolactone decarboxylase family protein [Deltaproteobacteria bacterium]